MVAGEGLTIVVALICGLKVFLGESFLHFKSLRLLSQLRGRKKKFARMHEGSPESPQGLLILVRGGCVKTLGFRFNLHSLLFGVI